MNSNHRSLARKEPVSVGKANCGFETGFESRGTDGSNPSPSSEESRANLTQTNREEAARRSRFHKGFANCGLSVPAIDPPSCPEVTDNPEPTVLELAVMSLEHLTASSSTPSLTRGGLG